MWSEKCSDFARCDLGPKLMTRCRPEKMDSKGHGCMLNINLQLEEGEARDRNARGWQVEGEKRRVTRKECKRVKGII